VDLRFYIHCDFVLFEIRSAASRGKLLKAAFRDLSRSLTAARFIAAGCQVNMSETGGAAGEDVAVTVANTSVDRGPNRPTRVRLKPHK